MNTYFPNIDSQQLLSGSDTHLAGFEHQYKTVNGIRLHFVSGGNSKGNTVVLLSGYPESWFAWRKVMPILGVDFHVIALDLPGQGDSDRPTNGYDTLTLATVIHRLIQQLDISAFYLAAHDVGAWAAYPYSLLFSDYVKSLALLDAGIPGITLPEALPISLDHAWRTWHFAFHTIPDLPETLITGKEREYLTWFLRRKAASPNSFSDSDLEEYLRVFCKEGGLRSGLAYYRAVDLSATQNKELSASKKLNMPVLAITADQGSIPSMANSLRPFCSEIFEVTIPNCGHFIPEEQPEVVAEELCNFFKNCSGLVNSV